MNLLALTNFPSERHAAAAAFWRDTLVCVHELGHAVTVMAPKPWVPGILKNHPRYAGYYREPSVEAHRGLTVHRPVFVRPPGGWYVPREGWAMYRAARRRMRSAQIGGRFDVVVGYALMQYGRAATLLAPELGIPAVSVAVGDDINVIAQRNEKMRRLARRILTASALVLTNSDALGDVARKLGADPRRTQTFYKGIDLSRFASLPDPVECRRLVSLPLDGRIILYTGRIMRRKGAYELVEAFGRISDQHAGWRLVMVGEAIEREAAMRSVEALGLAGRVTLRSIVPPAEVPLYLRAADLFVLPSYSEGVSNSTLEAMAAGLPVITTTVGGQVEVVRDGETGRLVPPMDVDALAGALDTLMGDAAQAKRMGEAARQDAAARFDNRQNAKRLVEMLEALISRGSA